MSDKKEGMISILASTKQACDDFMENQKPEEWCNCSFKPYSHIHESTLPNEGSQEKKLPMCSVCEKYTLDCKCAEPLPQKKAGLLELLNNPRTGLKDSSDTNKTRMEIFGMFDELKEEKFALLSELREQIEQKMKNFHAVNDREMYLKVDSHNKAIAEIITLLDSYQEPK